MVMELWIPITLFAAFMQNLRSALQKHIKGKLSTGGAAYVRFCYALPYALVALWLVSETGGYQIPAINGLFLLYCVLGGVAQILFTFLLVYLFSLRNFGRWHDLFENRSHAGRPAGFRAARRYHQLYRRCRHRGRHDRGHGAGRRADRHKLEKTWPPACSKDRP